MRQKSPNILKCKKSTSQASVTSLNGNGRFDFITSDFVNSFNGHHHNQHAEENWTDGRRSGPENPYDPNDFRTVNDLTSFWGTIFHVVILVTSSVPSIPSTLVRAGYVAGLIVMALLFGLYVHTSSMLLWSEYELCRLKRVPTLSYSDLVYEAFVQGPKLAQLLAKWARILSYTLFILIWALYFSSNCVLIYQNVQILTRTFFHTNISFNTLVAILAVTQIVLVSIPKLKYLVPFSLLGNVLNLICGLLVVYFIIYDSAPWQIPSEFGPLSNLPLFVGSVILSLNVAGILIPLKNEMKHPTRFTSSFGVLTVSYSFSFFMYSIFSSIFGLKYGYAAQPNILLNIPATEPLTSVCLVLAIIAILCLQPLILHVPFDLIWNQMLDRPKRGLRYSIIYEHLLRIVLAIASISVSFFVHNLFFYMTLSGTIGTSIDSLLLPALVHTIVVGKICKSRITYWIIFLKNMTIVALATILIIMGIFDSVAEFQR